MKFEVGDRVRLNNVVRGSNPGELYEAPPGTEGVIEETTHYPMYGVLLEDAIWEMDPHHRALSGYMENELELIGKSGKERG